jgi:hypothetical protein
MEKGNAPGNRLTFIVDDWRDTASHGSTVRDDSAPDRAGLCRTCRHAEVVPSSKGPPLSLRPSATDRASGAIRRPLICTDISHVRSHIPLLSADYDAASARSS